MFLERALTFHGRILDIDKLVEYRRPQYPSQCGEPQRTFSPVNPNLPESNF
jgi:hypothetical protein